MSDGGSLKVMTTNFREGYLRKNGVPYSETRRSPSTSIACRAHPRRRVAARAHDPRGPEVPDAAVLHEHDVQAGTRRLQVESDALPHRPAAAGRVGAYRDAAARSPPSLAAPTRRDPLPERLEPRGRAAEQRLRETGLVRRERCEDRVGSLLIQRRAGEVLEPEVTVRVDRCAVEPSREVQRLARVVVGEVERRVESDLAQRARDAFDSSVRRAAAR